MDFNKSFIASIFVLFYLFFLLALPEEYKNKNKNKQTNKQTKNTGDMQTLVIRTKQYTNNNLNIWAGTPQQLKPITADLKSKNI